MDDIINGLAEVSVWLENSGKKEYHETVEKACDELAKHHWIPVSERLPDDDTDALAYFDNGEETRIVAINYANGVWYDCIFNQVTVFKHITHWMPLPQPPKEGDGE